MPFNIALSGLNAASTDLEVTGNNVANSATNGFKQSRAEFGDLYASSIQDASNIAAGRGVNVAAVSQQFSQGSVEFTSSNLDLAISGEGFFVLQDEAGSQSYTRAGAYSVDRDGNVVNSGNLRLQAFPATTVGGVTTFSTGALSDLVLPTSTGAPTPTTAISSLLNVDASATAAVQQTGGTAPPTLALINPLDPTTFNSSTSVGIFDSLGNAHTATIYLAKDVEQGVQTSSLTSVTDFDSTALVGATTGPTAISIVDSLGNTHAASITYTKSAANTWDGALTVDGDAVAPASPANFQLTFNPANGALLSPLGGVTFSDLASVVSPWAGSSLSPSISFTGSTEPLLGAGVGTTTLTQNGIANNRNVIANTWNADLYVDGVQVLPNPAATDDPLSAFSTPAFQLTFDSNGLLTSAPQITFADIATSVPGWPGGSQSPVIDFAGTTQFGSPFSVNNLTQNGFASGRLSGIDIDNEGVVFARFTNGQSDALGKVALAKFNNPQGLRPVGDTNWIETFDAGTVQIGEAGSSSFGLIQSGALESSNVDLTEQLVNLIIAQRNFQANAEVISTADDITQTIINI